MATSSELKKLLAAYYANLKAEKKNAKAALTSSNALADQNYANTSKALATALTNNIDTMNQNLNANLLNRGVAWGDIGANTSKKEEGALRSDNAEQIAAALLAMNAAKAEAQNTYNTTVAGAQSTFNDNQLSYLNLLSQMNSGSGGGGGSSRKKTTKKTNTYSSNPYSSTAAAKQKAWDNASQRDNGKLRYTGGGAINMY